MPARKIYTKVERKKFSTEPSPVEAAVEKLVDFVKPTLGPKIRHILVDRGWSTELMDDGVSIAEEFELEDEFEDSVASYVRQASKRTDDEAGDGTTSTMVLLSAVLKEALESGKTYPVVKKELEQGVQDFEAHIKKISKKAKTLEDLKKVARTSMDDKEISEMVASVVHKAGKDGAVTIMESASNDVTSGNLEGFGVGRGVIQRGMVNDKERRLFVAPHKDFPGRVAVAVSEQSLTRSDELEPMLMAADNANCKNLVVFCPNMSGEALVLAAMVRARGRFNIAAVQLPGQGEKSKDFVSDLCTVTGASVAVKEFTVDNLGFCDRIEAGYEDTLVIGGHGSKDEMKAQVETLKEMSENSRDPYQKEYCHQRQARLQGGIAVIYVGADTDAEMKLRIKKIEDAVNSCRCALEDGICPGAGVSYITETSSPILNAALPSVHRTVLENAEMDIKVKEGETVNVLTGETGDYEKLGVVDASKVVLTAVRNAVSIAKILFSTSGIISTEREKKSCHS